MKFINFSVLKNYFTHFRGEMIYMGKHTLLCRGTNGGQNNGNTFNFRHFVKYLHKY